MIMRHVDVYVDQLSCIELHVQETVRIDRLQPTETDEYIAEPHGTLLPPGANQLQLEPGLYHFRTLNDAQLRVISGGVRVDSTSGSGGGTGKWPRSAGEGPCGRVPALSVVYDAEGTS
jgi:hypothetical protein